MFVQNRGLLVFLALGLTLACPAGETTTTTLESATALFDERRYAEAQGSFETLLEAYPHHPGILMYLGKLAAKRHERKLALEYLTRALEHSPDNAEIQFEQAAASGFYAGTLGTNLTALRYARQASRGLRRAIELDPDNLDFRQGFIDFSLEAPGIAGGGTKRALQEAAAISERDAVKGAFAHATIHRATGDHEAALLTLEELIKIAPTNYFALFNFGRCAAESGQRLDEGLAFLKRCLELPAPDQAPPPAHVWWNIATIQKQRADRPAAIAALREAVALAPNDRRIAEDLAHYAPEGV